MFFLPPKTILTIFFSKKSLIKGIFCCGATSAGSVQSFHQEEVASLALWALLDASSHLCMRLCPSVSQSDGWMVTRFSFLNAENKQFSSYKSSGQSNNDIAV